MKRLLAFLAHPDDESFGPGGTLARYAAEGVEVHIVIATDGAAGSVAEGYEHTRDHLVEVRAAELEAAVAILGATLHRLDYRDSGYINDPANAHPAAFINSDEKEAIGRLVALMRQIRPQVILTHNETGDYFHPDHIHCCKIGTAAFHAAGDPEQYPHIGPAPYQPQKLYYTAFSNRALKIFVALMRLRGQDPSKGGRNEDIDMTKLGYPPRKIHARINYRDYWDVKRAASAQHPSQGGGGRGGPFGWLPEWLQKLFLGREGFIRVVPPAPDRLREQDLFAGVEQD